MSQALLQPAYAFHHMPRSSQKRVASGLYQAGAVGGTANSCSPCTCKLSRLVTRHLRSGQAASNVVDLALASMGIFFAARSALNHSLPVAKAQAANCTFGVFANTNPDLTRGRNSAQPLCRSGNIVRSPCLVLGISRQGVPHGRIVPECGTTSGAQ